MLLVKVLSVDYIYIMSGRYEQDRMRDLGNYNIKIHRSVSV